MPDEATPLTVDVDLGDNGGRRLYRSIDELDAWFRSEQMFWGWLRRTNWEADIPHRPQQQLRSLGLLDNCFARKGSETQLQAITQLELAIATARQESTKPSFSTDALAATLCRVYSPPNSSPPTAIHSESPAGRAVELLRQRDPILAGNVLACLLQVRSIVVSSDEATAICHSVLHQQGIANVATAQKEALEGLYAEWSSELANAKKNLGASQTDLSAFQTEESEKATERATLFEKFMASSQESVAQMVESSRTTLSQLLETSKKELTDIERTYNEKLALQASVKYWGVKAQKHRRQARTFALTSVLAFLAGGYTLYLVMELLVGDVKINEVQVWKLGALLIVATVVVWAIRVLVRLLLSNLHLRDDAEERTTMLLTYLALLREGELPKDVRQLILQALFRPAATGIVKDDSSPPFMAQWLKVTTGGDN